MKNHNKKHIPDRIGLQNMFTGHFIGNVR